MKLNIDKEKLGDLILLMLFDKAADDEFMVENEEFNEFMETMKNKGMRSLLFREYFRIDPNLRSRYKQFKRAFQGENSILINISNKKNEDVHDPTYDKIIEECVKRITKKEEPNEEKLNEFKKIILNDIIKE